MPEFVKASRGQLCVLEMRSSATFANFSRTESVRYEPAVVVSVTREGIVKAVKRRNSDVMWQIKHLYGHRYTMTVAFDKCPKELAPAALYWAADSWESIEAARAGISAAIIAARLVAENPDDPLTTANLRQRAEVMAREVAAQSDHP